MPQRPPGAQLAAFVAVRVPPLTLLEKSESFFLICGLSQIGQMTSPIAEELLKSLSNESPQSRQTNSKIGIELILLERVGNPLQFRLGIIGNRLEIRVINYNHQGQRIDD